MSIGLNKIKLIHPPFESPVTDLIIDINFLKRRELTGSTHPDIFFQLKSLFHLLESIGSARIEGNNTTVAEMVENELYSDTFVENEDIMEIRNNEVALDFIEKNREKPITGEYICELHKIVVSDLNREGSLTPGKYRSLNPAIQGSKHIPPGFGLVSDLMEDLILFINSDEPEKYDLLKVAIAHHRFVWIHPFDNGNGRTVRLLTYAMLTKMGFRVDEGRIINPTAIFCNSRSDYYKYLQVADSGGDKGLLQWTEYMLKGLKREIEKIDQLLEYSFVLDHILVPALNSALKKSLINETEHKILKIAAGSQEFKTAHLNAYFKGSSPVTLSRYVKELRDRSFLVPISEGARVYTLSFSKNELLREIIYTLGVEGFLPNESN